MKEVLQETCLDSYKESRDGIIKIPKNNQNITVVSFPIPESIALWWKLIKPPKQMRVEPMLCTIPYRKLKPFFNNTGCVNPVGYMVQSGPRCQTGYLKWICENSAIPFQDKKGNGFCIPEANHATTVFPPQPYLIIVKDSFVSM